MKVNKYVLPILLFVAWFGAIGVAKLTGSWSTGGKESIALYDAEGNLDPEQIRGWMTLTDVSEGYGIPLAAFYTWLGPVEGLGPETAMKDLESLIPGFETGNVREFVAAYMAGTLLPPLSETGPDLTATAAPAVTSTPDESHTPTGSGDGTGTGEHLTVTPLPAGALLPADGIKGRMTLREVSDQCGVPLAYLIAEMQFNADEDPNTSLRDLASKYGIELESLKEVVRTYQAQTP